MINIIISLDYEIFGNGKGDIKKHILNPTKNILDISNKFKIPISIMFEIYEYIAYEKYNDELERDLGYSPAKQIKNQITTAYENGHDIQLHIHPQFTEMEYKQKKFILKNPKLSALDLNEDDAYKLIKTGKEKLESIINSSDYKCMTLRLSNMGWIEAPKNTLKPMEKLGLKIHSLSDTCKKNDNLGFWKLFNSQVYEIPIYSIQEKYYKSFNARRMFTLSYIWTHSPPKRRRRYSKTQSKQTSLKNKHYRSKWDFSKLSYKEMINYLDQAIRKYDYKKYDIPLVMMGHTKDFFNYKNFERFLETTTNEYVNKGIARFTTFKEFSEKYMKIGE